MFIADLFESYVAEAGPQLVVIYPGRFQPFHLGHADVFRDLQNKFGRNNVYIATSNKVEFPKSPFNFSDKTVLMHAAGIPNDRIIEVSDPYRPDDYVRALNLNLSNTIMLFAVGAPDAARLAIDTVYTEFTPTGRKSKIPPGKKVGDPRPFKSFTALKDCVTADQHMYVIIENERQKTITLNNKPVDVSHGTPARAAWNAVRDNPTLRSEYLLQMFGRDDAELGRILDKIPQTVSEQMFSESMIDDTQPVTPLEKQLGNLSTELDKHERYNTGKYPAGRDNVIGGKQPWDILTVKMPGDFKGHVHDTELGNKIKNNPATAKMNDPMVKWDGENYGLGSEVKKRARERYYETAGVGVIANKKQAKDPRYSHSLTPDIRPGEVGRQLKKMHLADSVQKLQEQVASLKEKWSTKYKRSINCNNPRGFSQRAHCQGRKK
jgi:cytidyltransferase-like protein